MKTLDKSTNNKTPIRPVIVLAGALLAIAGSGIPQASSAQNTVSPPKVSANQKVQLMFVQRAEDIKVDPAKNTAVGEHKSANTLFFGSPPAHCR